MRKLFIIILMFLSIKAFSPNLFQQERLNRLGIIMADLREEELEERKLMIKHMEFSIELLEEYMILTEPTLTIVTLKQFILESGWFGSDSFTIYNNLAGMRLAKVRETTATGSALRHAKYDHWTDSVDDYILWMRYWKSKGYCTEDFYKFLADVGYAEAGGYEKALRNINVETMYL